MKKFISGLPRKISVQLLVVFVILSIVSVEKLLAAPAVSSISLNNGVVMDLNVEHTRADETEFYNGERVNLTMQLTGGDIASGSVYDIAIPTTAQGAEFAYFLNTDSSAQILVNGTPVGSATYDGAGSIKLSFTADVSAADIANVSIGTNMAINENDAVGTQQLTFTISDNGNNFTNNVDISTTSNGHVMDVTLSRTTNVTNYSGVTVNVDWNALAGVGVGDYFEISLPRSDDDVSSLFLNFANSSEVLQLQKDGVVYGTARVVHDGNNNYKIIFEFTQTMTGANISGNVQFNASWYLNIKDTSVPRPTEKTYVIYLNGERIEYPITIGTPNTDLSQYDVPIRKQDSQGVILIGRNDPVAEGEAFYRFSWRAQANLEGLPAVSQTPYGETMHNAVITDEVSGPGHYIDISYMRIHHYSDWGVFSPIKDLPIFEGRYPSAGTATWVNLETYLNYAGADKLVSVPYGDGDPNHVKSFTLYLGDLEGEALEVEYRSYIMEGSDGDIPSYRDHFYQSVMTSDGASTDYFNKVTLKSDEYVNEQVVSKTYTSDGSASMTQGNLNLKVLKVDENGVPLTGVKFTLWWSGGSMNATTNTDGYIEFNNMGTGLYKLEETTPPDGYDAIEPVFFKIPDTIPQKYENGYIDLNDTTTFTSSGGLYDIQSFVEEDENGIAQGYNEIANYRIPTGELEVTKVDSMNRSTRLDNATFLLSRVNGGVIEYYAENDEGMTTWVVNESDATSLVSEDGIFRAYGLPYDTYTLTETAAPTNYQLDSDPITFTINDENMFIQLEVENTRIPPDTGEFTVTKVDAVDSTILLDDATFILSRDNGGVNEYYAEDDQGVISWVALESEATSLISEDGVFTVDSLPYGTYYLVETVAPDGYQLDSDPIEIIIDDENDAVNQEVENTKIPPVDPPETGDLEVIKVDAANSEKHLDDAIFILVREIEGVSEYYAEDNQGVIRWVDNKSEATSLVSEVGMFTIDNLPYGNYYLVETSAPDGYQLDSDPISVTIDAQHEAVEQEVENTRIPPITEPPTPINNIPDPKTETTTSTADGVDTKDETNVNTLLYQAVISMGLVVGFILLKRKRMQK